MRGDGHTPPRVQAPAELQRVPREGSSGSGRCGRLPAAEDGNRATFRGFHEDTVPTTRSPTSVHPEAACPAPGNNPSPLFREASLNPRPGSSGLRRTLLPRPSIPSQQSPSQAGPPLLCARPWCPNASWDRKKLYVEQDFFKFSVTVVKNKK